MLEFTLAPTVQADKKHVTTGYQHKWCFPGGNIMILKPLIRKVFQLQTLVNAFLL